MPETHNFIVFAKQLGHILVVPAIENGDKFCIRVFLVFPRKIRYNKSSEWVEWYTKLKPFQS